MGVAAVATPPARTGVYELLSCADTTDPTAPPNPVAIAPACPIACLVAAVSACFTIGSESCKPKLRLPMELAPAPLAASIRRPGRERSVVVTRRVLLVV